MNRVWLAPVCGQRVCVCEGALEQPTNNWQSIKQRVGFTTLVVHACQLVPCEAAVDDGVTTTITNPYLNWSRWHRLTIHWSKWQNGETWWTSLLCFYWWKGWEKWMIRYGFYCEFETATNSLSICQRLRCFDFWRNKFLRKTKSQRYEVP